MICIDYAYITPVQNLNTCPKEGASTACLTKVPDTLSISLNPPYGFPFGFPYNL